MRLVRLVQIQSSVICRFVNPSILHLIISLWRRCRSLKECDLPWKLETSWNVIEMFKLFKLKHAQTLLNLVIYSLGGFWPSKEPQAEYGYPLPMPPWSKMIVRLFYKAKVTTKVTWSHIMLYHIHPPCPWSDRWQPSLTIPALMLLLWVQMQECTV